MQVGYCKGNVTIVMSRLNVNMHLQWNRDIADESWGEMTGAQLRARQEASKSWL